MMGKLIGNGYLLVVVVIMFVVVEVFINGMEYFNIFGGNLVFCVIGRIVLWIV